MSQRKRTKKSVELENKAEEQIAMEARAPKKEKLKAVMNFDAYFQHLMHEKRGKVLIHHKAPMRKFAEAAGLEEGTKDEFDKVFRLY